MPFFVVRRRDGVLVLLSVAAVTVAALWTRRDTWAGTWGDTYAAVGNSLVLVAPLVVGTGAYLAGSGRRDGLVDLARVSPAATTRYWGLLALQVWACAGCGIAIGALYAWITTARVASYGTFDPMPFLPVLGSVLLSAVGGLACGVSAPRWVAAPLGVVVTYVVLASASIAVPGLVSRLTPIDYRWGAVVELSVLGLLLQAVLAVAIGAALVLRLGGARTRALVVGGLAASVGAVLLVDLGTAPTPDRGAVTLRCRTSATVEVCLPRMKAYLAADVGEEVARAEDLTAGLHARPVVVIDDEAAGTSRFADAQIRREVARYAVDHRVLRLSEVADLSATTTVPRADLRVGLALQYVGSRTSASRVATPGDVVTRWMLERMGQSVGDPGSSPVLLTEQFLPYPPAARSALHWLEDLDDSARQRWFARHRQEVSQGTLAWSDFR